MKRILTSTLGVISLIALSGAASAEGQYAQEVEFGEYGEVEASLTGTPGNAEEGAKIFGDKKMGNCVACHLVASQTADFPGTVGPELSGVGGYRSEAELRGIVVDANMTFEGTVMPSQFRVSGFTRPGDAFTGKAGTEPLPPLLTAQQIEDVVAYLLTLKDE